MIPSVITRSALVSWGRNPSPDLAYVTFDECGNRHIVTWAEVMEHRRKRQASRLELIRRMNTRRVYRFSVRYFDMPLMGGWQSALDDWRGHSYGTWPDRDLRWFKPLIMKAIPLALLPLGSNDEQWHAWKIEFAYQFKRRIKDRRPMGVAYLWWNRDSSDAPELISSHNECFRLIRENPGIEAGLEDFGLLKGVAR